MWAPRRSSRYFVLACLIVITIYNFRFSEHDLERGNTGMQHLVKSSFDWGQHVPKYPVTSMIPLPTGKPSKLPKVQHVFSKPTRAERKELDAHRNKVRKTFQKCWSSYRKHAWMRDELMPISGGGKETFGGWGATLIDSLDTLWIMELYDEFAEAVEAVATIDWANTAETAANIFETTIRYLGGLLSAYDLSHEQVLLIKAVELGDMLYAGFDTPNRLPGFWIDFEKARTGNLIPDDHQPSASLCSLSLEFTRLSQLTSNPKYYEAITRITHLLEESQSKTQLPGMWPTFFNVRDGDFVSGITFTVGALADSLYEYLPKMYALQGGIEPMYRQLSSSALETIKKHILFRPMVPDNADILFAGDVYVEQSGIRLDADVQHLSCFMGGLYALSGRLLGNEEYVDIGAKLTKGSIFGYESFPTGLMPEYFQLLPCASKEGCEWDEEKWKREGDQSLAKGIAGSRMRSYILRPEAIESIFILYRITGEREYLDAAWSMFESIQRATETEFGNAAIDDVTVVGETIKRDSMESFWLAETLKYFYLIFSSPDLISLDDYVFNTEAHPFRRSK